MATGENYARVLFRSRGAKNTGGEEEFEWVRLRNTEHFQLQTKLFGGFVRGRHKGENTVIGSMKFK